MKSRRLKLVNRSIDPVANGGNLHLIVSANSENLSFSSPFSVVSLASDSNNTSDNEHGPYSGLNARISPSVSIILYALLGVFFLLGIISICLRKRGAREDESLRLSRRAVREARAQLWMEDDGYRGLDRAVIESFPVFSYDLVKGLKAQTKETLECAVCLNEFEDDEQLRLLPKCTHAFHPECIDMWLYSHTTCPVCRTSLVPADDANPTGTDYGIVEPMEIQITSPYEVPVVVDGITRNGSVRRENDIKTPVAPEGADSQESLPVLGHDQGKKFRRSYSTGNSLVRLRKESDQLATEWYISTTEGLKPGLQRNCSFTARESQGPSTSETRPGHTKQASFSMSCTASCTGDIGGLGRHWYERGFRSGPLTISSNMYPSSSRGLKSGPLTISSMNPTSSLTSYSEKRTPAYPRNQESSAGSQQERKVHFESLKNTLKRFSSRDRELADVSQSGRGSFRMGAADNSQSGLGSCPITT